MQWGQHGKSIGSWSSGGEFPRSTHEASLCSPISSADMSLSLSIFIFFSSSLAMAWRCRSFVNCRRGWSNIHSLWSTLLQSLSSLAVNKGCPFRRAISNKPRIILPAFWSWVVTSNDNVHMHIHTTEREREGERVRPELHRPGQTLVRNFRQDYERCMTEEEHWLFRKCSRHLLWRGSGTEQSAHPSQSSHHHGPITRHEQFTEVHKEFTEVVIYTMSSC